MGTTTVTANGSSEIRNLTGAITSVDLETSLGSFTLAQLNEAISDNDVAVLSGNNSFTGKIGIGTTTQPSGILDIEDGLTTGGGRYVEFANNVGGVNPSTYGGLFFGWNKSGGLGESVIGYSKQQGGVPRLDLVSWDGATYVIEVTLKNGKLGIGIIDPQESLDVVGKIACSSTTRSGGFTVATLPSPTLGDRCFVTDALAPVALATVVAGGAVKVPVFYDSGNWIVA